ncbi:MAG: hypothetical protein JRG94_04045 [Deltaproteobacteria bacterium]|nr:hypothetical protein [Deltaproteobacteria bacterium]
MTSSPDAPGSPDPDFETHAGRRRAGRFSASDPQSLFARLYAFRFTFGAVAAFILLYVFTIRSLESYLEGYFEEIVEEAVVVTDFKRPLMDRIQFRIDTSTRYSVWAAVGGVEVSPIVLGRDGSTLIYAQGQPYRPLRERYTKADILAEAERLLPATVFLSVSIPHNSALANSILIFYAALTVQALWFRNRSISRKQNRLLAQAVGQRRESETRARAIETELDQIRLRFHSIEPTEPEHVSEVNQLREERKSLEGKLAGLEIRELELRESVARESALGQEITALEDLLEEASDDLSSRGDVIRDLEKNLKRASKGAANEESARTRESDVLHRRFAALYRNLEIDDRAINDIVALRDEAMKLKCEEKLKRLNDEADNLSVRRKVGGIPPHLTIFEMGFAGKGRLYYMKGNQRRFRVLNVGAKNTQNAAIEYLRKL